VAEVRALLKEQPAGGPELLEPDQVHLSFPGYRVMARAVLGALGRPDAPVADRLSPDPMPGLIREWKIRPVGAEAWSTLRLPQTRAPAHWWLDQERRRGFAVELDQDLGGGKRVEATAIVDSAKDRDVFLNTGADLQSIRLNGSLLWKNEGWTGWHAGKERLPARLRVGPNTLQIEAGTTFFLSVTEENNW
jgi:hypothetical protein